MSFAVNASSWVERNRSRLEWLIPALLCCVMFGQLFFSSRQLSQTADEATHLYSGYRYLKCGDLTISPEHPPLAKIVAAAPLLAMNTPVDCRPFQGSDVGQALECLSWFYASPDWRNELFWCRLAASLFAVGLCLVVWMAARRMFGFGTAVLATLLVIFEPNLLAHGALITTDMAVTATLLFAVFGFYLWSCRHSVPLLLLTGVAAGLTLLSKHSGVAVLPILFVLASMDALLDRGGEQTASRPLLRNLVVRNLAAVGLICALAFVVVWIGYGMRYALYPGAPEHELASAHAATSMGVRALMTLEEGHLLPQAYLDGFAAIIHLTTQPGGAFILGKSYAHTPWFFFPLNLLVRCTAAFLAMSLLSVAGIVLCFKKYRREVLFLLIPSALFLAACMHATWSAGMRHLLPMLPFALMLVAAGCMELAKRASWMKYAVPCLLVLHAASSLHASPNYLSYANEFWGGPQQAYKLLGGQDWGQSYLQAREYMERHPSENCWLLTGWQWNPELYDLHCKAYGFYQEGLIPPRMRGTVIVSSELLAPTFAEQDVAGETFRNAPPAGYIGGSALLVFHGDFDTRMAASLSAERQAGRLIGQGRVEDAMQLTDYAVQVAPENFFAHYRRANALIVLGQLYEARSELEMARALALKDPSPSPELRACDLALQQLRN